MAAWNELDLSQHNHKHVCRLCGKPWWHQGRKVECLIEYYCPDCRVEEEDGA